MMSAGRAALVVAGGAVTIAVVPSAILGSSRASGLAVVLRSVLNDGPVARSTIARRSGLSPAAVTRHTADLAALGLIRELPTAAAVGRMGRPHTPLDIDVDRHVTAGLHIAATHSTLALLDLRGRVVAQDRLPHRDRDPVAVLTAAARRLPRFAAAHAAGRAVLGVGVAAGGWVDPDRGVIMEHHPLGWHDVPAGDLVAAETGLPVRVDSHARALLRAEQLFGQAGTAGSVVHLFVGHVVDAAIVTGDTVHHGPRAAAGDIAHQPLGDPATRCPCGRMGCLQATVSDRAVSDRAVRARIVPVPSLPMVVEAARRGDPAARRLFRERAAALGAAVALLLDVLNPEVLVVTEAGLVYLPECLDVLRGEVRRRSHVRVDPADVVRAPSFHPDDLRAMAAGAVLLDAVYANPAVTEDLADRYFPTRGLT
jgi:predicted NBD/HSP70 family sugar kinase